MAKITKMKDRVEAVLDLHPATRGNDRLLIYHIWQFEYNVKYPSAQYRNHIPLTVELFQQLSSPETIRRARQLIQAEGKYLPPPEVQRKRLKQEVAVRREVSIYGEEYNPPYRGVSTSLF